MAFIDFTLQPRISTLPKWLFLALLSLIYQLLIRIWLLAYRLGLKSTYHPQKPLISVGNITVGGTGKTPMVDWLLDIFEQNNKKAVVLTRGYKADKKSEVLVLNQNSVDHKSREKYGDEPWMLFQRHPQSTFYISPDRVASAQLAEKNTDFLILDDGMQHLRIGRDLNIVLIDSLAGIGNGRILPLGPLREPLSSLNRADVILFTRSNLAAPSRLEPVITPYLKPDTPIFEASFHPESIVSVISQQTIETTQLTGKKCLLFSGIGNPASFKLVLEQLGCEIVDHIVFPDHYKYKSSDLKQIQSRCLESHADYCICTEKDFAKVQLLVDQQWECWYLKMKMMVEPGFTEFVQNKLGL